MGWEESRLQCELTATEDEHRVTKQRTQRKYRLLLKITDDGRLFNGGML